MRQVLAFSLSGVSDQPMSDEESIRGATNRAKKARAKLNAEYGVGLEGGLHKIGKLWFDAGWIVIINQKGQIGYGSSVRANTPKKMINKVKKGMELGLVDDLFFNLKNSKQNEGHFGLITKNAITRTLGYRDGVIMALARFIHPDLFE
jgi:inosine/xanthosine triphosphatase